MSGILKRDTVDTFSLGCLMLIAGYILSVLLLIEQYERTFAH